MGGASPGRGGLKAVAEAALLLVSAYLPGHLAGAMLVRKGDGWAELAFLRLAASVALATPLLVALALLGWFRTPVVVGMFLILAATVWVVRYGAVHIRMTGSGVENNTTPGPWDYAFFGLVAGAGALYAWKPAEYVINDRDPGVYALVAAKLARTGELLSRDPLVGAIVPFHEFTAWTKYPGFYIYGNDLIVPQFFPGPFALLGLGDLIGGTWGGLYVVPILGALSIGAVFLLGRELFDGWTGLLGAALLAVSLAQTWWARHPSSEVMAQFFVLAGLLFAARFLNGAGRGNGLLAGLLLGGSMLLRVDAFLALAVLPVLVGRDLLLRRPLRPWAPLLAPVAVLGAAAVLYANTVGGRYLNLIHDRHGLAGAIALAPYAAVIVLLCAAVLWILHRRGVPLARLLDVHALIFPASLVLAVAALWAYLFVPEPWDALPDAVAGFHDYDPQAAVRLVWVATPPVAVLGISGFLLAARRVTAARLLLLGAVATFGIFYVASPNVSPDLPWASRRFVPAVFPGLCLLSGYAIAEAGRALGRSSPRRGFAVSGLLAAVAFATTVYVALPVYGMRELGGTVQALGRVDEAIPRSRVVYVGSPGDDYASALDQLFGRPVLPYDEERFQREAPMLREAGLLSDAAYVTVDGTGAPETSGLVFREVGREEVSAPRLAPTFKSLPRETYEKEALFRVFVVEPR